MRKIIVLCCAVLVLAGCGTVAKEVTPEADTGSPVTTTANVQAVPVQEASVDKLISLDATAYQSQPEAAYTLIPEGVLVTVLQEPQQELRLRTAEETNLVYLPAATEVLVSVDPGALAAYAAVAPEAVTPIY